MQQHASGNFDDRGGRGDEFGGQAGIGTRSSQQNYQFIIR